MRISIPFDSSSRSFIPPPCFCLNGTWRVLLSEFCQLLLLFIVLAWHCLPSTLAFFNPVANKHTQKVIFTCIYEQVSEDDWEDHWHQLHSHRGRHPENEKNFAHEMMTSVSSVVCILTNRGSDSSLFFKILRRTYKNSVPTREWWHHQITSFTEVNESESNTCYIKSWLIITDRNASKSGCRLM